MKKKLKLPKLGALRSPHDHRTFFLEDYAKLAVLPPVKPAINWHAALSNLGMMKNDVCGDCTCAGIGHAVQTWTANETKQAIIPDAQIVAAYSAISGYNPRTGANDNGANMLDVLNYARNKGVGGHKISAFMSVNPKSRDYMKLTMDIFGTIYLAAGLPLAAQGKTSWDTPKNLKGRNAPGSWGGHAIVAGRYNSKGFTVITWGQELPVSWGWWDAYGEEAWAILSPDWIADGKSPSGFDLAKLQEDLAALK